MGLLSTDIKVSDEKLEEIQTVLDTVGLTRSFGLDYHIRKADSYRFGGYLEWTERWAGTRFIIYADLRTRKLTKIITYDHGYTTYTKEDFERANAELERILS